LAIAEKNDNIYFTAREKERERERPFPRSPLQRYSDGGENHATWPAGTPEGTRGEWTSITGPGPGERELPLLRLLFSIVHDYDTGPCRGGCERDRMSHSEASFALALA